MTTASEVFQRKDVPVLGDVWVMRAGRLHTRKPFDQSFTICELPAPLGAKEIALGDIGDGDEVCARCRFIAAERGVAVGGKTEFPVEPIDLPGHIDFRHSARAGVTILVCAEGPPLPDTVRTAYRARDVVVLGTSRGSLPAGVILSVDEPRNMPMMGAVASNADPERGRRATTLRAHVWRLEIGAVQGVAVTAAARPAAVARVVDRDLPPPYAMASGSDGLLHLWADGATSCGADAEVSSGAVATPCAECEATAAYVKAKHKAEQERVDGGGNE